MLKRLRIKFAAVVMIICTLMLCVLLGTVYHLTKQNLETESISMMQAVAGGPMRSGKPLKNPENVRLPYFIVQVGTKGEIVAGGDGYFDLSDESFLNTLVGAATASREQTGIIGEYNLRFCKVETMAGQKIVFADISSELSTLAGLAKTCFAIGVLCLMAFFVISLLLARWMVRPVERAWEQQKRFVADASHELKTPLTVITTNAELLQSGDCDTAERARFTDSILIMSAQMRSLVERMLDLARADSGQRKEELVRLDLSALVEDALLPFEPVFFERGLTLESDIESGIAVQGSAARLGQIVEILLDNARKYAGAGGTVRAELRRSGRRHCRLVVSNTGEPIAEEDMKNIFKRFYRADKARSRDGSFGLGLSIAESITTEHGGRIWAESRGGWNSFFVELPTK